MKTAVIFLSLLLTSMTAFAEEEFRPYEIKPGVSYYADDFSVENGIAALGEEKNFEEVWQNYNYYEAVFDERGRIVTFRAYTRGAVEFSEAYFYDADGRPEKKIVTRADGTETVVEIGD